MSFTLERSFCTGIRAWVQKHTLSFAEERPSVLELEPGTKKRYTLSFTERRPSVLELELEYAKARAEFRGGKIDDVFPAVLWAFR